MVEEITPDELLAQYSTEPEQGTQDPEATNEV